MFNSCKRLLISYKIDNRLMDYIWFGIYTVVLLLFLFVMLRRKKLPYAIVFVVAFVFFPLLSTIGIGGLFLPSDATHFCVLISILGFFIFYYEGKKLKIKHICVSDSYEVRYDTRNGLMILANMACLAVYLYLLPNVKEYYAVHMLSDGRQEATNVFLGGSARMAALYSNTVKPIASVSFLILIDNLFRGKKIHYLTGTLCLLNMILDSLIFAGRALLVQCFFYVIFDLLFFRNEVKLNKKQKKLLISIALLVLSLFVFVVIFISQGRSGGDSEGVMTKHLVWYYVGPFVLFDYYVNNHDLLSISNETGYFFGSCVFGPIYNLGYMVISALITSIDYQGSDHLIAVVTQNTYAPIATGGVYINAAVTAMYPFFKDFWFLGLFLGFGFYGCLLGFLEKAYSCFKSQKIRLITLIILYVIFKLEMRYELGPTMVIQILLILVFIKKRIVKRNAKET